MEEKSKTLAMFRARRRRNKLKAWGLTLLIIFVNLGLLLWLSPYILPLGYDLHTLHLDQTLILLGVTITIVQILTKTTKGNNVVSLAPFPGRHIPALRRGLLYHHPRQVSPLLPPLLLAHGVILLVISPGAILWSYLLPGETRRWASRLINLLGPVLILGGGMHWALINLLIKVNPPLLYAHIIASTLGAISIPGIAAIMYAIWGNSKVLPFQRVLSGLILIVVTSIICTLLRLPWIPLYLILIIRRCSEGLLVASIGLDIWENFR